VTNPGNRRFKKKACYFDEENAEIQGYENLSLLIYYAVFGEKMLLHRLYDDFDEDSVTKR